MPEQYLNHVIMTIASLAIIIMTIASLAIIIMTIASLAFIIIKNSSVNQNAGMSFGPLSEAQISQLFNIYIAVLFRRSEHSSLIILPNLNNLWF